MGDVNDKHTAKARVENTAQRMREMREKVTGAAQDLCIVLNNEYGIDAFIARSDGVHTVNDLHIVRISVRHSAQGERLRFECGGMSRPELRIGEGALYPIEDMRKAVLKMLPKHIHIHRWLARIEELERMKVAQDAIASIPPMHGLRMECTQHGTITLQMNVEIHPSSLPDAVDAFTYMAAFLKKTNC